MLSFQRREEIKRMLLQQKSITVGEVAKKFQVSDETVRRDLAVLCNEGFCTKTYGGASLTVRSASQTASSIKKNLRVAEKKRMAEIAATQIKPKDCIFLDHSTTAAELCSEIRNLELTVVTNYLWVIRELANQENIDLVVTGGSVRVLDQGMFGAEAQNFLRHHYFDKAFFSCRSLNLTKGVFDSNEQIASFRQVLSEQSARSFLMADSTKFGVPGFVHIMPYKELDVLITDAVPNAQWSEMLTKNNVTVMTTMPE